MSIVWKQGSNISDNSNLIQLDEGLFLDLHLNQVIKHGFILPLSATQARLLERLSQNIGIPIPNDELIRYTWGDKGLARNSDLYVCVNKIRNKLGDKRYLLSVHSVGYMLVSYMHK